MSLRPLILGLLPALLLATACDRQSPPPVQANRSEATAANQVSPDEVSADEVAPSAAASSDGLVHPDFSHKGAAAPATRFSDGAGRPVTLAAFRGKPMLVNLWASWCGPCVAEMPTLNTLAAREAGKLQVVAVNQDTQDAPAKVAKFFADKRLTALLPYRDEQMALSLGYQANLPTTVLYDVAGREVVRVTGGMDWSGADAAKLLALAAAR